MEDIYAPRLRLGDVIVLAPDHYRDYCRDFITDPWLRRDTDAVVELTTNAPCAGPTQCQMRWVWFDRETGQEVQYLYLMTIYELRYSAHLMERINMMSEMAFHSVQRLAKPSDLQFRSFKATIKPVRRVDESHSTE